MRGFTLSALVLITQGIEIEEGGKWGSTECAEASKWHFAALGDSSSKEELRQYDESNKTIGYELNGNEITISADKKSRTMMGIITCSNDSGVSLGSVSVNGKPVFANLPNALTNLDGDFNKRIECEASGYPLPLLSWKFQAIIEEVLEGEKDVCEGDKCTVCQANCHPEETCQSIEDENDKEECISNFYQINSTDLFAMGFENLVIRYANTSGPGCPMNTEDAKPETCRPVGSAEDVNSLPLLFKAKSQLLFTQIGYIQGGKYVCVATQGDVIRSKSFVWRVKDPMAALWPFLGLVLEVMVVVAVILYYEKASTKGDDEGDADEEEALRADN